MTPRRATALCTALALAAAAFAAPTAPADKPLRASAPNLGDVHVQVLIRVPTLETQLLAAVNRARGARGLRPFRASRGLRIAAARHSTQMARHGFFDHEAPGAAPFWQRLQRFYGPRGFRAWSVGENILYGQPTLSAAAALREWLTSPPHRANLLSRGWRDTGLAAVYAAPAPGVYGNAPATVITMDFGLRRR